MPRRFVLGGRRPRHGGCWSKLQNRLYTVLRPELQLQMHCTNYVSGRDVKGGPFDAPRHWITLEKEIIWDFPSYFLEWNHPDVPMPLKYLESGHGPWGSYESAPAQLILEYLATPVPQLLDHPFDRDYWGLINIFRAADRRLGQRQLRAFAEQLNPTEPAVTVMHRRFTLILGG